MDSTTYEFLTAKVFGDKDFVVIMNEKMRELIRRIPKNEMEAIALNAKIHLIQDFIDTGILILKQGVSNNENSTQDK